MDDVDDAVAAIMGEALGDDEPDHAWLLHKFLLRTQRRAWRVVGRAGHHLGRRVSQLGFGNNVRPLR